ncbi:hypothetical protein AVEN_103162-1 [Araneus ventricosus]|uniref:Uncharacterized protein n=1 Tax=Araneus ventricosus TaxID=182803 RepID=A0A4Y2X4E8_ARAVE|nr:hypothetical protein AVEN_103162-1 [Araneus ventricosus]
MKTLREAANQRARLFSLTRIEVKNVRDVQILAGGEIFWVLQPQRIEKINKHLFLTQTLFGYTVQRVTRSPREGESHSGRGYARGLQLWFGREIEILFPT